MTITVKLLREEALPLLRSLERLQVLQVISAEKKPASKTARNGQPSSKVINKPVEPVAQPNEIAIFADAVRPLRKNLTLEELLTEQNFKGFDRQELDKLIAEINVQEPIEELLAMLSA